MVAVGDDVGEIVVEVVLVTSVELVILDEVDVKVFVGDEGDVFVLSVVVVVTGGKELELPELDEYVFVSVVGPDSVDCIEIGVVLAKVPLEIPGLGDVRVGTGGEELSCVAGDSGEPVL